jgi:WD40 repeat protein
MKYKAFLSYAWPDRGVAVPLHRKLERIGKRRWWDARARRVFLDRESAVASDDLWAKVENALRESSFLVVLASPRAAASPWVQREVEWWRRHRDRSTPLIVLVDGSIHWDDRANDFTPATGDRPTDALPGALRGAFATEPEWVPLSIHSGTRASSQAITECAAALVATIENVAKDQVLKRDARQRRRVAIAASALLIAAGAGVFVGYREQQRANRESETARAIDLANEAMEAMSESHLVERGALLALESLHLRHLPENDAALRRALTLLPRAVARYEHPQRVFSIATSRSGKMVATGGGDGATRVFGLPDLSLIAEGRQSAQVFGLAFSPDDALIVSASGDETVRAIDAASGKEHWIAATAGRAIAVSVSADGQFVATGTDKHEVMVLALTTGKPIWRKLTDNYVGTLTFSPDSRFLASAVGGTLQIFEASTGAVLRSGQEAAHGVTFGPDGRRLAAAADKVKVLTVGTWATEVEFDAGHLQTRVAFASDSSRLASNGNDGVIHIWHVDEKREAARFELGVQTVPAWLTFAPDGNTIASGWWDKTARVIDAATGLEQWRVGHEGFVLAGAFTPNGHYLVTGGNDGIARVSERPDVETVAMPGRPYLSVPLIISPGGHQVAAVREDRILYVLDRESGASVAKIPIDGKTTALRFMPDETHVVLAVTQMGVRLLDVRSGREVWQVPIRGQVDGVAPAPDGKSVAVATWGGHLMMLDAQRGATIWTDNQGATLLGVSISADGRRVVAVGAPLESRVLDAATGTVVWRRTVGSTSAATLSDDGALVALALADESVVVYRVADDTEVFRVPRQGTVVALAFSPDGQSLAVGGNDRTARVFDVISGSERVRIPHDDAVWAVAFTPDGKLITNQGYNLVRWHAVSRDALASEACSQVSRSLTRDEWARYLPDRPYRRQCEAVGD